MSMIQQHRMLARPGLRKDFQDTYNLWEPIYSQYLRVGTHDSPEISATTITGPNRLVLSGEASPVVYQELKSGPKVMAVDKTYKGGFWLSKEAIMDDKYGKLNQGSKWLAEAARLTQEFASNALIDDAFTGTFFKGMDNLSLFSTAHTLINSNTTVPNRPTNPISLSVGGMTALQDLARKCKNENGDPIIITPDTVMIANDQAQLNKLYQILDSDLEPFTANNQDNPIKKSFKPKKVITNPYMTNLYHYMIFDSARNDSHFLMREQVSQTDWYDEEVDASKIKARGRWIIWFYNWRAWYGTNPSA